MVVICKFIPHKEFHPNEVEVYQLLGYHPNIATLIQHEISEGHHRFVFPKYERMSEKAL